MAARERVSPAASVGNCFLAQLADADYDGLCRHLEPVSLGFRQVLYEPGQPIEHVYFPTRSAVSHLAVLGDGAIIEVASVGREGIVGVPALLGAGVSRRRCAVTIAGDALRVPAALLQARMP